MSQLEKLLHRMRQHKQNGKKVLSVDYVIQAIENDITSEASRKP